MRSKLVKENARQMYFKHSKASNDNRNTAETSSTVNPTAYTRSWYSHLTQHTTNNPTYIFNFKSSRNKSFTKVLPCNKSSIQTIFNTQIPDILHEYTTINANKQLSHITITPYTLQILVQTFEENNIIQICYCNK